MIAERGGFPADFDQGARVRAQGDRAQGRPERADRREGPRPASTWTRAARSSNSAAPTASRWRAAWSARNTSSASRRIRTRRRRRALRGAAGRRRSGSTWSPTRSRRPPRADADWIEQGGFRGREGQDHGGAVPRGAAGESSARATMPTGSWPARSRDEKLEVTKANAASYSLALIELADVAPKDAKPEQTGLDKPTCHRHHPGRPDLHAEAGKARGRQLLRQLQLLRAPPARTARICRALQGSRRSPASRARNCFAATCCWSPNQLGRHAQEARRVAREEARRVAGRQDPPGLYGRSVFLPGRRHAVHDGHPDEAEPPLQSICGGAFSRWAPIATPTMNMMYPTI